MNHNQGLLPSASRLVVVLVNPCRYWWASAPTPSLSVRFYAGLLGQHRMWTCEISESDQEGPPGCFISRCRNSGLNLSERRSSRKAVCIIEFKQPYEDVLSGTTLDQAFGYARKYDANYFCTCNGKALAYFRMKFGELVRKLLIIWSIVRLRHVEVVKCHNCSFL